MSTSTAPPSSTLLHSSWNFPRRILHTCSGSYLIGQAFQPANACCYKEGAPCMLPSLLLLFRSSRSNVLGFFPLYAGQAGSGPNAQHKPRTSLHLLQDTGQALTPSPIAHARCGLTLPTPRNKPSLLCAGLIDRTLEHALERWDNPRPVYCPWHLTRLRTSKHRQNPHLQAGPIPIGKAGPASGPGQTRRQLLTGGEPENAAQ